MHDDHNVDANYYPQRKVETEKRADGGTLLKGEVEYCVPKGTPIKLKLATVPTKGLRLLDRDLEGELRPAKVGQRLSAKTTEDIFVDTNKVIPTGTTFYGYVSKIHPPRRLARPGHLEIQFTAIKLPDGRTFAFKVDADNFKKSTAKTKAKGFGRLAAYAGGGAVLGAIIAYRVSGWQTTAACDGYNIAGGAAAGAIAATTYAIMKRGKAAVLEPGDDLNMKIDADLLMPVSTKPTPRKPPRQIAGLSVDVRKAKPVNDGLGGKLLRVDLSIDNNTRKQIRSVDFYLEDTNGNRQPISMAQGDEDSELLFTINPFSNENIRVHFGMEYPKLKHRIVILDHSSRKIAHVIPL